MSGGYTFHKKSGEKYSGGFRWQCSSSKIKRCNAIVVLSEDDNSVIRIHGFHNHEPPNYHFLTEPQFINMLTGKTLLMVESYTFHKNADVMYSGGIRWSCSSKGSRKCHAFVVLSKDAKCILRIGGIHSHEPPRFQATRSGYIRLTDK
ncbi:uncharacterized protein [Epargyreus clarus]|uniref:uncharacterized protein n=1 Tax=Epargyreus clarus TaxID=520877 RepID=UPI003C2BF3D3